MIKLFRFLKPYGIPISSIVILVFFQALSSLYLPTLMSDIVDSGIINGDINYITATGGLMLLVALAGSICAITASLLSSQVAMGFGRMIRSAIFDRVSSFSLHEFDKFGTPSLVTRCTNDITQIQNVMMFAMRMVILSPLMCIGAIIMAISKDKHLAWVIIAVVPVLSGAILILARKGFPLYQVIQAKLDKINLVVRETLIGIRVIRAFNRIENEKKRFQLANLDLTETAIRVNQIMALMMPVMMLLMNFTTLAVIWFGGINIERGFTNIGNMMAFLQYAMQIMFAIMMATMMFIMIPRAQAAAVRVNEVLATDPEIVDPEYTKPFENKKGYLKFTNVTFHYHGAEEPALKNVSFEACPGEVTAIIGSTGSGKSTLINLIPRFYDVNSGKIEINGVDVREMTQETLRSKIGLVPQKAVLFSGTISENIRYGKEDSTDAEVQHAAEIAQATEFISDMKDGFASLISEGGTNVSGGQKQRLSIARALVGKPEIYVFDDSFSALDFKTDAKLRAALKKETADSTLIIVGQRVATIMDADRIIVLDEGKITGIGTHKELYQTCEVYREIVASQLSEEEIA
ncbi:MAG TPA: multidrug ABC transporter ATP-binding protein [Firmicutes bacterium]|jgi:ATP-binding cassette, subfamily B, multidrug efflux pump|nr:multidrug ABC transporter ATP-binding protein [Bacillota bacterium]